MKTLSMILASFLSLTACATDELDTSSTDQQATAVLLGGKYYYQTDHFSEQCGASTLKVRVNWSNASDAWSYVPRNDTTYLKPAQYPNGTFDWVCGNQLVNGTDHSECNNAPANYVRFFWDFNSRNIDVRCFKICGDGSSAADCIPY